MMKHLLLSVLLSFLAFGDISAQTIYDVRFSNPSTHYAEVDMHLKDMPKDSFDVKMPVWIPGSYMVREFSRQVEGFKAVGVDGSKIRFKKVRKNVWRVYNDSIQALTISYKVYAFELTVRTSFIDAEQAYINGPSVFMYTEETRHKPSMINFFPKFEWSKISTGLPAYGANQWTRIAENYDQLADSPIIIGNHDLFTFDYKGIPHHVAMVGKAGYDREKIKTDFWKIVDECTKIYGENPNKEYTFIVHNVPSGGGGLEHMNSTSVITRKDSYEQEETYNGFLSLIAHEYFHLWHVKRLRPIQLGPFDYENENYTTQLWFFEGFTSYYDDYILHRAGFRTRDEYLAIVTDNLMGVMNTPGDSIQSLAESSFDAWIKFYRPNENSKNATVSYYSKGGIVGMLMDIEIMSATNGASCLDDVLRFLYNEYYIKQNRGITDQELMDAFEKVAGKSFKDFFDRYIYGTERLPYESILAKAGVLIDRTDGMVEPAGYLGATFSQSGNKLVVSQVERGSAAWNQGLNVNDEILDIDGKEPAQVKDHLAGKKPTDAITMRVMRAGSMRNFTIILGANPNMELEHSIMKKPEDASSTVLNKWLKP
ncbi:MAG: M61 family metallopeptidase [Arcticibacter sp.]